MTLVSKAFVGACTERLHHAAKHTWIGCSPAAVVLMQHSETGAMFCCRAPLTREVTSLACLQGCFVSWLLVCALAVWQARSGAPSCCPEDTQADGRKGFGSSHWCVAQQRGTIAATWVHSIFWGSALMMDHKAMALHCSAWLPLRTAQPCKALHAMPLTAGLSTHTRPLPRCSMHDPAHDLLAAGQVFPLSELAAAVAESQKVGRLGKVLLKLQ